MQNTIRYFIYPGAFVNHWIGGWSMQEYASADTKEKIIDVTTGDASSYQVGDRVIVFGELSMGMMAVLWAFIIPFCILVISLFVFMAIWSDELLSALCSLALLIPYYYILWLNKTRMEKKFSFSIRPID